MTNCSKVLCFVVVLVAVLVVPFALLGA